MGEAAARYEWALMLLIPFVFGAWQLVSVRRSIARDKAEAERHHRTGKS